MNNFLGVQDAPRKRRDPNMEPGPWAGSVITTDGGLVCVLITNDKWLKAQGYVEELEAMREADEPVSRKRLLGDDKRVSSVHHPYVLKHHSVHEGTPFVD